MTYETHGVPRRTPAQGPQRRGLNYLSWRAAECVRRSLAATVQERCRAGRCVLKMGRRELTTWVVFVGVSAVWMEAGWRPWRGGLALPKRVRVGLPLLWCLCPG
jgi:hypothetical protein